MKLASSQRSRPSAMYCAATVVFTPQVTRSINARSDALSVPVSAAAAHAADAAAPDRRIVSRAKVTRGIRKP